MLAFWVCLLTFSVQAKSTVHPLQEIRQYVDRGDTVGMGAAMWDLNQQYNRYHGKELFDLLLQGKHRSEHTDFNSLFGFYSMLRRYYEEEGNSSKAMEYALKCYNMVKDKPENDALYWIMIDIGNIFYNIRDFNQAQVFYEKAIGIANRLKDPYGMSVVYLNLGMVADQKKEYEAALKYYKLSASYRIVSGNTKFVSTSYLSISDTYFKMNKPDSARYYIDQALHYYNSYGDETDMLIYVPANCNLGYYQYYASKGDFRRGETYLRLSREEALKKNISGMYTASFFIEARWLMRYNKYDKAVIALQEILPSIQDKNILITERDIYQLLSECYTKLQRYQDATRYFEKYLVIEDSIERISLQTQFNTIRAITEVHENEVKLSKMQKDIEIERLNNEMERRQSKLSYNIAAVAITGFLVILFLFWQFILRGKKVEKLQSKLKEQNNNIKIQSNELRKSNQVKDKIFSVIAHDLRNPLNRLLVELALIKQEIPAAKSSIATAMENTLKETIDLFERLLEWSKRDNKQIVYSPSILNLSDCINKVISFYLSDIQSGKIKVINNCSTLSAYVDANVLLTLLRNIMGNAIKAIGPNGTIEIKCSQIGEKEIELIFSDSGSGFSQYILNEFNNESRVETVGEGTGLMLCKMLAKYNGWPIRLSNDSDYGGAKITLVIPAYRKKAGESEISIPDLEQLILSRESKVKLQPVTQFKLYQTSELMQFLKSIQTDDEHTQIWIANALEATRQGNKEIFQKLIARLDD